MGLIPKMESLPNFCSDASLAQYQQHRCVELGAQAGENTLPDVCERLVASMSAYIHNGAIREYPTNIRHRNIAKIESTIHNKTINLLSMTEML